MAEMIPEGQGSLRVIKIADPGVGLDFQHAQEANVRWRIMSLSCTFTASGNAATREINLDIVDGGNVVLRLHIRNAVIAGETWSINFYVAGINPALAAGRVIAGCLPEKLLINGGKTITSYTTAIDAGDQYSGIYMMVEEWIEPLA